MGPDQAEAFVTALGAAQLKTRNGWVTASCPLARFTHKNRKDTNPSFGVRVAEGAASNYNCYSCGSGSLEQLLQTLELYWQKYDSADAPNFKLARQILHDETVLIQKLPPYQEFASHGKQFQEWPQYCISYPEASFSALAMEYLHQRQVTEEEVQQWNLRFDPIRSMIVFPLVDVYYRLGGARGRSIHADVVGWKKHYDYTWNGVNNTSLVWFNEPCLNSPGPVVVVEGQFDALRVAKAYPKVVANMTAKPMPSKLHRLVDSQHIIHIPDNDGMGGTGELTIALYRDFCKRHGLRYSLIQIPLGIGESKIDPGDCHPVWLLQEIQRVI